MKQLTIALLVVCLSAGCATYDEPSVLLLSNRLEKLERSEKMQNNQDVRQITAFFSERLDRIEQGKIERDPATVQALCNLAKQVDELTALKTETIVKEKVVLVTVTNIPVATVSKQGLTSDEFVKMLRVNAEEMNDRELRKFINTTLPKVQ